MNRRRFAVIIDSLQGALETELRDSLHIESALQFYADGNTDGGECARLALSSLPSQVLIDRQCADANEYLGRALANAGLAQEEKR